MCAGNGAVELYYDNSKKLETTTHGVKVTGSGNAPNNSNWDTASSITTSGSYGGGIAMIDGSAGFVQYLSGNGADWWLKSGADDATPETNIKATHNGAAELYYDGSVKLQTHTSGISVTGTAMVGYNGSTHYGGQFNDSQTSGTHIQFQRQGYNNGNITHDTNNSAYNTSGSDRTLKKNFEDWTDSYWTAFKNLKPQKFHFLTDEDSNPKCRGYIAQDLVATFPEAYPKEVVSDKYMFNPSGMVPYLMKTLQEAITKIETLETKVAALEGA